MYTHRVDRRNKPLKKDYRIIDLAWDKFSDYIGEQKIETPLSVEQFEEIFKKINKDEKFTDMKDYILESFQQDCYSWPLVKRNSKK